mmetsp:Transcript_16004/g.34851  ORF Transcript_16004/g.34851 Transcript_16004/m.34851 type:complete len:374 (-) Transcript_16004:195-1316(-)
MFYEPFSDFFYDPKTKFYYSNAKKRYFRYDLEKGEFQPIGEEGKRGVEGGGQVAQQQGTGGGQGGDVMIAPKVVTAAEEDAVAGVIPPQPASESKPEKVELKPKIAISLKTALPRKDSGGIKSLNEVTAMEKAKLMEKTIQRKESSLSAGGNSSVGINDPAALSQSHKEHNKDMDKWSERVKEMRDEENVTCDEAPPSSNKVRTTASGQPICVLCRRKFANLEKMRQHERLSALHKENLAKKAAADAAKKKQRESSETYRDRSKERRLMYGGSLAANPDSSSSHAEALLAHALNNPSSDAGAAETVRPEETLNDANVGNKLLQKLGWKSGETLGRSDGNQNDGGAAAGDNGVVSNLKSDWERIESLAQRGGRR